MRERRRPSSSPGARKRRSPCSPGPGVFYHAQVSPGLARSSGHPPCRVLCLWCMYIAQPHGDAIGLRAHPHAQVHVFACPTPPLRPRPWHSGRPRPFHPWNRQWAPYNAREAIGPCPDRTTLTHLTIHASVWRIPAVQGNALSLFHGGMACSSESVQFHLPSDSVASALAASHRGMPRDLLKQRRRRFVRLVASR